MPEQTRKLAAIMFTDIAGYTESMSYDEQTAIQAVKKKRSIIQPLIKDHNGVFVKEIGDGTLSYFSSAVDASNCAINLQEMTYDEDHLNIRVGLHIGDIVFDGEDVFGEGVNIASRLESLSPVGGVCVSKNVYDELENKKEFNGESLGLQTLKGVGRLVEVYALKGDKLKAPDKSQYKATEVEKHTDEEVPSIAIIPFKNKGADEDVFYAYGISADLITECSSAGLIRVASLSDVEKLDYTNLDNNGLSEKLFVRYVSQGMLWKMGNMFQLSIELYDTKEQKVVWSDRWQENWANLPNIKSNLSDGLLKALDTKPKVEKKVETANPEAYEFYLKANYKYNKRENTEDVEIVRGLLKKAIEIDDNLLTAKILLGLTYTNMSDYDRALQIYTSALQQAESIGDKSGIGRFLNNIGIIYEFKGDYDKALDYYNRSLEILEELGDKKGIGMSLNNIGIIYRNKGDEDKALDYYNRSLEISEELGDKSGIGQSLNNIGNIYNNKGDYEKALDYHNRSLEIREELGDKSGIGVSLNNIGVNYSDKGNYEKALDYYNRSLEIFEELGNKHGIGWSLYNIGYIYNDKGDLDKALDNYKKSLNIREEIGDKSGIGMSLNNIGIIYHNNGSYEKAVEPLEKSLRIQNEIGVKADQLRTTAYLNLDNKKLGKDYDKKEIHTLIKESDEIDYEINFRLFELLEDKSYLETAYKQVQEKADEMDEDLKEKFLNYPIPKQIVEAYQSLKLKVES